MTRREKDIVRIALSYMTANLADIEEACGCEDGMIDYNGEIMPMPTEAEIEAIIFAMQ